jgi:MoaA/NifB/PqqE/SkfB family radical SAM enzyme
VSRQALQLLGWRHGSRALTGPTTVQVDLTDACNQNCHVCWLHAPDLEARNRARITRAATLPFSVFEALIDELVGLGTEELYFAGGGEPLVHPRVWDALELTIRRGLTASLHTNFSLIDAAGVRRLVDLGIHHVTVSLWAATPEGYQATHPGTDPATFDRVTDSLAALNALKVDRPVTKLYHVLTAANVHEAAGMLELAERLGCDHVELAVADVIPGATDAHGVTPRQAAQARGAIARWLDRAAWRRPRLLGGAALDARLTALAAGNPADSALVHAMPCFAGWTYARVMADGRVIPCLKAHRVPSGNVHDESFAAIWQGARQRTFRDATRVARKKGPFFGLIGNDEDAACGCELGCDNLADNRRHADALAALTGPERLALRIGARFPDRAAALLT